MASGRIDVSVVCERPGQTSHGRARQEQLRHKLLSIVGRRRVLLLVRQPTQRKSVLPVS